MERKILDYSGEFNEWLYLLIKASQFKAYVLWYSMALVLVLLALLYALPKIRLISDKVYFWLENEKVFLSIISLMTLLLRLPIITTLEEFNPDESQFIAGAATLVKDWHFWLSVDGMTSGPLNFFPLTTIYYLGGSLNYGNIRLWAVLFCIIPTFIFVFYTLRQFFDTYSSKLLLFPLVTFFAFPNFSDFVTYSSEHVPMLLTAIAMFLAMKILRNDYQTVFLPMVLGLILGCFPYAKLQAAPIGLVIALVVCTYFFFKKHFYAL